MIQFDPGIWVKRLFYTPVTCSKKPPSINALPDRITDVETPKGFPCAQAPKSTPTLKCTSIVCWFNADQHLLEETLQEACDLSTHAHLSFLVPVIQFFKFPLYVIN